MNNDKPVDDELFRNGEPGPDDTQALLTQYRLFVETSEAAAPPINCFLIPSLVV